MVSRTTRKSKNAGDLWQADLVSTVGKPIPTKELINRLQAVADHLTSLDQTNVDLNAYSKVASELVNKKVLSHQNEAVRANACCAIADILRIHAPDAPYSEEELSRIFKAFFGQLGNAWDSGNSFFPQQSYILTRLVEVRSIILVVDLPDAADLITLLFDTMYDLAAKGFPRKLEQLAADMLAAVIAEAEVIPKKVVSTIFKSLTFQGTSLTTNSSNISHPGFVFSVAVCEGNTDKMSRQVAQLFSEMLDESVKSSKVPSSESSFKTLEKIHSWSIQIWKHVPEMLESIIGLIGDELGSDSEKIRLMATKTIGEILAVSEDKEAHINIDSNPAQFVVNHSSTWSNWLKKSSDVSPTVRASWVAQLPGLLNSPSLPFDIVNQLRSPAKKCLLDSSEKVRLASARAVESLAFSSVTSKLLDEEILRTLFSLLRERDEEIRSLIIRCCCYVYDNFMRTKLEDEIVDFGSLKPSEIKSVEAMIQYEFPNQFLQLNYINDPSITTTVDVELIENLLPFTSNAAKRCSRLCMFYSALDTKSRDAFKAILTRQRKYAHALTKFLELSAEHRASKLDSIENKENVDGQQGKSEQSKEGLILKARRLFSWFAATFPEIFHAESCLERIFMSNNARHNTLLKNCVSPISDYKTIKNSIKELIVSLQNQKISKHLEKSVPVTTAQVVSTVKVLLYRASPILFNQSNINELLCLSKQSNHEHFDVSNELLEVLSSINPEALSNSVGKLTDMLVTDDLYNPSNSVETILRSVHHSLKVAPEKFPDSLIFTDRLLRLAKEGSPVQAKYSIKVLSHHPRREQFLQEVLDYSLPLDPTESGFATKLASIAEICVIEPDIIEGHVNDINSVITERVLKQNRHMDEDLNRVSWVSDEELMTKHRRYSVLSEKLTAIRYIVNRIRALCRSDKITNDSSVIRSFEKPVKLLSLVVSNSGEIVKQTAGQSPTPLAYQARLRLEAGFGILKLAKIAALDSLIDSMVLSKIGRLMYDSSLDVRKSFTSKLLNYISSSLIPEKFTYLVFLAGHEPDQELKAITHTWVRSTYRRLSEKKDLVFERALARLIHGIAHDGRFLGFFTSEQQQSSSSSSLLEALEYASRFIFMYLANVSSDANISFLYYIASRVKQYRDATVPSATYESGSVPAQAVHLYRVAELCQLVIKEYADSKTFTLQTWPGKMKLPNDIFSPMENFEEASIVIGKQYIDDDLQVELRRGLKALFGRTSIKRAPANLSRKAKKQKKPPGSKKSKSLKKSTSATLAPDGEVPSLRRSSRARKAVKYEADLDESGIEEGEESDFDDNESD